MRDPAGNEALLSSAFILNINTLAPESPVVASALDHVAGGIEGGNDIGNGGLTNDSRPILNGSAEAHSVVRFYDAGNNLLGSVAANEDGNWQWQPEQPLPEGTNTLTLTSTDAAGNISDASAQWVIEVDTLKPNAPTVTAALDSVAGGIEGGNDIGNGGLTNDNRPLLKGSAEAHSVIRFYDANNNLLGSVVAEANGQWQWRPDAALPEGTNTLALTSTDAAGNISDISATWEINVDTVVPDNHDFTIDSVDSSALWAGNTTNDVRPQLSGTGEKDALVKVYQNGNLVGSVIVDGQGHWDWRPIQPLADGDYAFSVTVTDLAGNVSAATLVPVAIIVDTTPPAGSALIGAIAHDEGFEGNGSDFISNYVGTGRLISGTVQGNIANNERIQISTDNGLSWHDVQRDPQGGWYWADPQAHTSDWSIQTRVIDNLGRTSTAETQHVIIDNSKPDAPFEVFYQGQEVTVHFSSRGTEKDGHVSIKVGENYYLFAVSDADSAQGYMTVTLPDTATPNDDITAAVVNRVGNVSDYRDVPELKAINFKNYAGGYNFAAGTVVDGVTFDTAGHFHQNDAYTGGASQGWLLHFWSVSSLYLNKNELGTKYIEFNTRTFASSGTLNFRFYYVDDNLIHTWPAFSSNGSTIAHISYTSEIPICRVEFDSNGGSGAISVMDFAIMRSYEYAPENHFTIDANTEFMPGTDQADMFDVQDVADLAHLKALAGGLGIDTLRLLGADQTLDFTQLADKVSSIEVIDISGSGNNTLNLSLGDIMAQGQNDLFHADGNVQMMVKGNSGDVVNLSDLMSNNADPGDWNQGGSVTVGGLSYQLWQHSGMDAELLVQDGVTVNAINH